jgi:integrase
MRLKDYDTKDGKRVWLSEAEIQQLLANVDHDHTEAEIALRLMARSGLRRREVTGDDDRHGVRFVDVVDTDQTGAVVRVWRGKGDKYREPPAPEGLAGEARIYRQATGRDPDAELVEADPSTLYDWVQRARERCHAESGDEVWLYVGPHDLRRSWGVRLLESGVMPSVVMEWGGWQDWQTFRNHYLAEFSPQALRRERGKVEWLSERAAEPESSESDRGYAALDTGSNYGGGR